MAMCLQVKDDVSALSCARESRDVLNQGSYLLPHVSLSDWYKRVSEMLPFDTDIALQTQTAMSIINKADPSGPENMSGADQYLKGEIQNVCLGESITK
jgi:hypothetical protein